MLVERIELFPKTRSARGQFDEIVEPLVGIQRHGLRDQHRRSDARRQHVRQAVHRPAVMRVMISCRPFRVCGFVRDELEQRAA
jgi:hypothetical protein